MNCWPTLDQVQVDIAHGEPGTMPEIEKNVPEIEKNVLEIEKHLKLTQTWRVSHRS
jgi:hypothetical protein